MTKWNLRSGGLYYSSSAVWSEPLWRIQIYWPEVVISKKELRLRFTTTFRLLIQPKTEWGIGFQIFGFGFGVAWADGGGYGRL